MAFRKVDANSKNAITNSLSLFDVPDTDVSVTSSSVVEFLTLNPVNIKPFHFKIHASQSFYDLAKCHVLTELRIRKEDAEKKLIDLSKEEKVAVCQIIGNTLWKNCRININGTQIFEGNSLMAYKNIFDYTLAYPETAKKTHLTAAGYHLDDDDNQTGGRGWEARRFLFKDSRTAQFIGKLDVDLCNQPRYLVNQCEVDIELQPNDSRFLIVAQEETKDKQITQDGKTVTVKERIPLPSYHIEVLACKLYVKKHELIDSITYDINKFMEKKPAVYPLIRTSMRALFISENRTEFTGTLWHDVVPKRVVLALVANENYVGSQTTSPFDFQHFNIRDVSISASGVIIPAAPYNLDFDQNRFARAFHDMNEALGHTNSAKSNGINMKRYRQGGCCFFVFNLTSSGEDNGMDTFDLVRSGATTVQISFNKPVQHGGIVLVAMCEHESAFYLDKNRSVSNNLQI